jgi:hypothetical protein
MLFPDLDYAIHDDGKLDIFRCIILLENKFLKVYEVMVSQFIVREDVMKRFTLASLTALILMLTFAPVMSANAEVQLPAYIKFKGYSLGKCGIMRGPARMFPGWEPPDWIGLASGSIFVKGHAKGTSYEQVPIDYEIHGSIYGMAYFADSGDAYSVGFLNLIWYENDELHQLCVILYPAITNKGIFQPETDKFVVGANLPVITGKPTPSYRGIYKVGSSIQYISGPMAVVASRGEIPPYEGIEFIQVALQFGDCGIMAIWFSQTFELPGWGYVPAATMLVREVGLL